MQTCDNDDLLQCADDEATDAERNAHKSLNSHQQDLLDFMHNRTDYNQTDYHTAQQGDERSDNQVKNVGDNFFQTFFDLGSNNTQNQGGEHRA